MKNTSEKNVFPLSTEIRRDYCKPCRVFLNRQDEQIYGRLV